MEAAFQQILAWVSGHQGASLVLVFVVALGESLAIIGTLVPGVTVMLLAGALAGLGVLDLWEVLLCAAIGAIAGDGLSFWLGARYQQQLKSVWPLSRYPELIPSGEAFFLRHGGKSILMGRFFGPVRAVIPSVAGILGMPPWRFYSVNITSALLWAPATILPGVAFGAALSVAAEVASTLVALVLGLLVVSWVLFLLIRLVYRRVQPRAEALTRRALDWAHAHPHVGPVIGAIIDPQEPELRGLLTLALVLALASTAWFVMLVLLNEGDMVLRPDGLIHGALTMLQMPWLHALSAVPTAMAQPAALLTAALAVTALLWQQGQRPAALHWVGATSLACLIPWVTGLLLGQDNGAAPGLGAFVPDLSLTLVTVLGGIFLVMASRSIPAGLGWLPWSFGGVVLLLTCGAFFYQYRILVLDATGAIGLGLSLTALMGIAWRRHSRVALPAHTVLTAFTLLWLLPAAAVPWLYPQPPAPVPLDQTELSLDAWLAGQGDFTPKTPQRHQATLQWADDPQTIRTTLQQLGWAPAVPLNWRNGLRWLQRDTDIGQLPVVPHVYDGFFPTLVMSHPGPGEDEISILRLWHSHYRLPDGRPILVGTVTSDTVDRNIPLVRFLVTARDHAPASALFRGDLAASDRVLLHFRNDKLQITTKP